MIFTYRKCGFFVFVLLVVFSVQDGFGQKWRIVRRVTHRQATWTSRKPFDAKRYQLVGLSINALNYYGDLSPLPQRVSTDISFTRPGIGISYGVKEGPRFSWQTQWLFGYLRGSDAQSADKDASGIYRQKRNASFRNPLQELSASIAFDLFDNHSVYINRPIWTPFVFAGVSVFHHNPQAIAPAKDLEGRPLPEAGKWVSLQPLGTEGQYSTLRPEDKNYGIQPYKLIQAALFGGYGAKFRLSAMMDFSFEISFRYTFTDYLDDVSHNYVDLGVLNSELARAMSYRTNELNLGGSKYTYVARNGVPYSVEAGYGSEHPDNMRGNPKDRDLFMVTTFKFSRILGKGFHGAKSR